jgi:hypothetical protein
MECLLWRDSGTGHRQGLHRDGYAHAQLLRCSRTVCYRARV